MKIQSIILFGLLAACFIVGCGKQNPIAPKQDSIANNKGQAMETQQLKPTLIAYEGTFSGDAGAKPWYWFDADDDSTFNAQIRTNANGASANITRVNGDVWGKVHTFDITCTSDFNKIRIFVPSHSSGASWKLGVQEKGGQWRHWIIQDSTVKTGYFDYCFWPILWAINTGSGKFSLEIVAEGAVGEYVEVAELYVFKNVCPRRANNAYWEEIFAPNTAAMPPEGGHTPGWLDHTTNPDFNAVITNIPGSMGKIILTQDYPADWGKVLSPVLKCNTRIYKKLKIDFYDDRLPFKIGIQEMSGEYRHWWLTGQQDPNDENHFEYDLTTLTDLTPCTEFSVEISYNKYDNERLSRGFHDAIP